MSMNTPKPIIENYILMIALVVCIAILGFFYLNYHYFNLDFVLVGVFQELLMIPSSLGLVVVAILGFINWKRTSFRLYSLSLVVFSLGMLAAILLFFSFQPPKL